MVEQLAFEACSRNSLAGVGEIHRRRERTHAALTKNRISMGGRDSLIGWLVSWCFKPSQPQRIITGLREISIKRYIVAMTYMAEIRPEE